MGLAFLKGRCTALGVRLICRIRRVLFLLLVILVILTGYVSWSIYSYAGVQEDTRADAAIVLGAAVWGSRPSPVFRERINHAVSLYKTGMVKAIIFTGGHRSRDDIAESVVARKYAMEQGIPKECILIETRSRITEQNLIYAKEIASTHGISTYLIVSDPLHMKRAILMARDLDMNAHPSPTPTTKYRSAGSKARFLARETFFYILYLVHRGFA